MKRGKFLLTLLAAAFTLLSVGGAQAQKKREALAWPAANLKWIEMKGGPPGLSYVDLWGHMDKGAYGVLVKLPAGMDHPLHVHTSDVKLVVVSGMFWYKPDGGTKVELGPGSYLMVPGGLKHTSGTGPDGVEMFQEGPGKFDMLPVEAPAK